MLVAARIDDLVDSRDVDSSELCVIKDRVELFRFGALPGANGDPLVLVESNLLSNTLRFRGVAGELIVTGVIGRDSGRLGRMNPYRSTSAPSISSQSSIPPANSSSRRAELVGRGKEDAVDWGVRGKCAPLGLR
jgi:hypothetical protein